MDDSFVGWMITSPFGRFPFCTDDFLAGLDDYRRVLEDSFIVMEDNANHWKITPSFGRFQYRLEDFH